MELETAASSIEVTDTGIQIRWSDGARSRFHALWLRDNCPSGGVKGTLDRVYSVTDLNPDLFVLFAERNDDGDLAVEFSDGHESAFDLDWLQAHSHETHDHTRTRANGDLFRAGHDLTAMSLPTSGSEDHLALLEMVDRFGVAVVSNVDTDIASTMALAELVNTDATLLRHATPPPGAEALLDPSTSGAALPTPPGICITHCVEREQSGSDVVLVDGFAVALDLEDDDPDAFDLLAHTAVPFLSTGQHRPTHAQIISLDHLGDVAGIRFDERAFAPLDVDPAQMGETYRSLIAFTRAVNDPSRAVIVALQPGEALIYDNHRVLTGRTAGAFGGEPPLMRTIIGDRSEFQRELDVLRASILEELSSLAFDI